MNPFLIAGTGAVALSIAMASASPDSIVVFNEVHYNPAGTGEDGEWIELFNQMGIKTDLSGWRIDGIGYTFPNGTILDPGDYLVVAKTPGSSELGPFPGNISNSGERLRLYNQGGRLMDELNFDDDGLWPAAADGSGATLAKRTPYTASFPAENWTRSQQLGGTPGWANFPSAVAPPPNTTVALIALADPWRYNESGSDLGTGWASTMHPVGGDWSSGAGGLGSERGATIPLGTTLTSPTLNNPYVVTYYFEREFDLSAANLANLQTLKLRHGFDDGAVIYLNGVEALGVNMPSGSITAATFASGGTEIDTLSGDTPLPTTSLISGTNRISVEVHQEGTGSNDIVFGIELDAEVSGVDPNAPPTIVFNEIPPASDPNFWVELLNTGTATVDLTGLTLSVGSDPGREYALPAGQLAPGGLWQLNEATLGFQPADGEKLFLYDAARTTVLDGREVTGRLRGRAPGRGEAWLYPSAPTPGAANSFTFNEDVVISEIAYNPPALPAVAEVPATFTTVELVPMGAIWRYNDTDESLPANWAASAHPAGGNWKSGPGPIGWESDALPVPLATVLSGYDDTTIAYYFETDFTVSSEDFAMADALEVTHLLDDGAVFYLNGFRVGDFNMPDGAINPETPASPGVTNATLKVLQIPKDDLLPGTNRLSIEVHQNGTGSSDVVFGTALNLQIETSPGTPALPVRNSDNQWLELANRSASPVDLGGWSFDDGIGFNFPPGTILAPGEHACLARNAGEFSAAYPGARLLGEFSGSLSRTGERLLLRDAHKNPADELHYYEGGRWPGAADGGGSTLELRDLDADNAGAESWAASDEFPLTSWKTYSYRGTAAASRGPDSKWSEFNFGLLQSGEILIDDLSVIEDPDGTAIQKLSNGSFSAGSTGWRLRGTHRHGEVIDDPDAPGNKVLHLKASGGTGHMHNQIESTLLSPIVNGREYEISFRARWVSGSNQLHTRLYFHRLPMVTTIDRPANPGTPSAANSRAEPNIGPSLSGLRHSPAVPDANGIVDVRVRAADPDGVTGATLFYSVSGGPFQSVPMNGNAEGLYTGQIPGYPAATVVQFYVQATDGLGAPATFPAAGPDSRALYKVNDGLAATNGQHNFRIVVTDAERDFIHEPIQVMSNDRIGATIIDREEDIYYDVKLRLKGSERARNQTNRVGFNMRFSPDQPYRGIHQSMAIDRSEGVGQGQIEILWDFMIANSGGIISRYYDFIKVLAPKNQHTRSAVLQMARYDDVFLDSQFEDGSEGSLYEYEALYTPNTADANGFKIPEPDGLQGVTVGDLGDNPERYRWFFLKKNNREADDFAPIIAYCKKFSQSGAAFDDGLDQVIDVDSWLRGMAYAVLSGSGDNAGAGTIHNGMYYAKPDGRVVFFPHDMDFQFSISRSIFANAECAKLTSDPTRRRIYLGHLHDIISTTFNNSYMSMWTTHMASFDPGQNWSGHLSYITSRSNNVLSQINGQIAPITFAITTPSPLTVGASTATVSGDGWVNVREIRLAGATTPLEISWVDGDSWQAVVPITPGSAIYTLEALDFSGAVIATDTITIDNTGTVEPASAANLAVSELMYNPSDPTAGEIAAGLTDADLFEFIELTNIGSLEVDLGGARFTGGINFDLPNATIPVGERVVIARHRAAFLSRHPGAGGFLVAGEYGIGDSNKLSDGGEEVVLVDSLGSEIRRFTYDDDHPWPLPPDGDGPSLTLIAPQTNPHHGTASNWRASASSGGSPGTSDATVFAGTVGADTDHNGIDDLMDYALGHAPGSIAGLPTVQLNGGNVIIRYHRNLAADDVVLTLETSTDLINWTPPVVVPIDSLDLGGGVVNESWQLTSAPPLQRLFVRLSASPR